MLSNVLCGKRKSLWHMKSLEHNSFSALYACNYFYSDSIGFNFRSLQFFMGSLPCDIDSWHKVTKFLNSEMFHLQVFFQLHLNDTEETLTLTYSLGRLYYSGAKTAS